MAIRPHFLRYITNSGLPIIVTAVLAPIGFVSVAILGYRLIAEPQLRTLPGYVVIIGVFAIATAQVHIVRITITAQRRMLAATGQDLSERLRERAKAVNAAFTEAARLMEDLQRDLAAQQAAREALLAQTEEQQRLLEVNEEQAEKIRQILVGETKATIHAERRQQWLFFALGVFASIPIGVAINLLVP
ncbi:hypothetical protein HS048_36370 [Planomonospora sp. ID91781]|uniref:hypothetical protein n=1 Tax=Planomonospora sp. ID91781 TaxID=2738135 RepID=UPI0018C40621|nr:hypothetical protein [Planomonospora sp. ID91781]MBG0826144.1 hypothetical protein [Planomonospora sp. ID91781]